MISGFKHGIEYIAVFDHMSAECSFGNIDSGSRYFIDAAMSNGNIQATWIFEWEPIVSPLVRLWKSSNPPPDIEQGNDSSWVHGFDPCLAAFGVHYIRIKGSGLTLDRLQRQCRLRRHPRYDSL